MSSPSETDPVSEAVPTQTTSRRLPSEMYEPGHPIPIGSTLTPDTEHIQASGKALAEIAAEFSGGAGEALSVRLCSFRLDPLLSPNLFGFHVYEFDNAGNPLDSIGGDTILLYAVVVNHSISLQQEIAALFLMQLINRQARQRELNKAGDTDVELDIEMAKEDEAALQQLRERFNPLTFSWRSLAQQAHSRASEAGIKLSVEYGADVFPDEQQIRNRIPWLRRIYNDVNGVRSAIDKLVSAAGKEGPSIRAAGGSSQMRDFLQQWGSDMDLQHYFNQAVRDAEVCGNGYAAMQTVDPVGFYNLRPETVAITPDGFEATTPDGPLVLRSEAVIHLTGIDQVQSPYGISMIEAFMPSVVAIARYDSIEKGGRHLLTRPQLPAELEKRAQGYINLAQRGRKNMEEAINDLLWFPSDHLPEPATGLYFEGHSRMQP